MHRRVAFVPGIALLWTAALAVPATAATCDELQVDTRSGVKQVAASMNGQEVVTSSGTKNAGDPDGNGTVVLTFESQDMKSATVGFTLDTNNIAIPLEGAHIHHAPAGQTGLTAVTLFGFTDQADRSGTVTMSKCLVHDVFTSPSEYYVDVHNDEYPDQGAIRGQLNSVR